MQTSWSGWPTVKVASLSFLVKRTGSERSSAGVRSGSAYCHVAVMTSPARSKGIPGTNQDISKLLGE